MYMYLFIYTTYIPTHHVYTNKQIGVHLYVHLLIITHGMHDLRKGCAMLVSVRRCSRGVLHSFPKLRNRWPE